MQIQEIRIQGLECRYSIRSIHSTVKKIILSIISMCGIWVIILSISGCSDNTYLGSMLTPNDVSNYIYAPDDDTLCLTNGIDTRCVTLVPKSVDSHLPVIHIYPTRITYIFYYEGVPIMRVDKPTDSAGDGGKQTETVGPPDDGIGGTSDVGGTNGGRDDDTRDDPTHGDGGTPTDDSSPIDSGPDTGSNGGNNGGQNGGNNGGQNGGTNGGQNGGTNGGQNGGTNGGQNGGTNGGQNGGTNGGQNGGTNGGQNGGTNGGQNGGTNGGQNGGTNGGQNGGNNGGKNGGTDDESIGGRDDDNGGNNGGQNGGNNGGKNGGTDDESIGGRDDNTNGGNNDGMNDDNTDGMNDDNTDNTNGVNNDGMNDDNTGGMTDGNTGGTPGNGVGTTHNIPANVLSHYIYNTNDDREDGWIVWIYYPANYNGPRKDIEDPEGCGFTLSVSGGTRTNFIQTQGPCSDGDNDNRDDYNGVPCTGTTDYSAQFYVASDNTQITITIRWTAGIYSGTTQTFTIRKEINLAEYDDDNYDHRHTNQEGWD